MDFLKIVGEVHALTSLVEKGIADVREVAAKHMAVVALIESMLPPAALDIVKLVLAAPVPDVPTAPAPPAA